MSKSNASTLSKEEAFSKLPVPKVLAKFIIPSVVSQLTFLILNLADAFFVGRTEDTYQIAAMTITFPVCMTIICIANIFGVGANANIATELGKGNKERAKNFSSFAIITASVLVVLISILVAFIKEPLLAQISADENSMPHCLNYIFWAFHMGCIPLMLAQLLSQLFLAEGETKWGAFGIMLAGILNIALDPIFIFVFDMGVAGAGAATCIANWCALFFYVGLYLKRKDTTVVCFSPKYYKASDKICAKTLSIGVPAGLVLIFNNVCDFTRNFFFNSLGGQVELAAWGVVQKIGNAFTQICVGIAQGVRPIISYNYSAGLLKRVKSIITGSVIIVGVYVVICVLVSNLFPTAIVNLLIPSGPSVSVAVSYLRVWIFCVIGNGFIELFNALFQALGQWKISMANTIINKGLLMTPVMILLTKLSGINGIVASQVITENVTAIALAIICIIVMKRELTRREKEVG